MFKKKLLHSPASPSIQALIITKFEEVNVFEILQKAYDIIFKILSF